MKYWKTHTWISAVQFHTNALASIILVVCNDVSLIWAHTSRLRTVAQELTLAFFAICASKCAGFFLILHRTLFALTCCTWTVTAFYRWANISFIICIILCIFRIAIAKFGSGRCEITSHPSWSIRHFCGREHLHRDTEYLVYEHFGNIGNINKPHNVQQVHKDLGFFSSQSPVYCVSRNHWDERMKIRSHRTRYLYKLSPTRRITKIRIQLISVMEMHFGNWMDHCTSKMRCSLVSLSIFILNICQTWFLFEN